MILSSQKRICLSPSPSSLMCTQTSVMWQLSGERTTQREIEREGESKRQQVARRVSRGIDPLATVGNKCSCVAYGTSSLSVCVCVWEWVWHELCRDLCVLFAKANPLLPGIGKSSTRLDSPFRVRCTNLFSSSLFEFLIVLGEGHFSACLGVVDQIYISYTIKNSSISTICRVRLLKFGV